MISFTAPCGHPGTPIFGQFVLCPTCDTMGKAPTPTPAPAVHKYVTAQLYFYNQTPIDPSLPLPAGCRPVWQCKISHNDDVGWYFAGSQAMPKSNNAVLCRAYVTDKHSIPKVLWGIGHNFDFGLMQISALNALIKDMPCS